MFELPEGAEGTSAYVACALLLNLIFIISIIVWIARERGGIKTALGFLLSHTVVGVIALPFILSVHDERRWVYSITLWLIDLPLLPLWAAYGEDRSPLQLAIGYFLIGGAIYAIGGFFLGLIALRVRRSPRTKRK